MKRIKSYLLASLAAIILLSASACGNPQDPTQDPQTSGPPPAETTAEATTKEVLLPEEEPEPPLEITSVSLSDFSGVDLAGVSTDQSAIRLSSEGHLLFSPTWRYGDYAISSFSVRPQELMALSPDYSGETDFTAGAILFKMKRENVLPNKPHTYFLGPDEAEVNSGHAESIWEQDFETGYEYFILQTDQLESYMNQTQPILTMLWADLGSINAYPDGISMRLEEMVFYRNTWDALYDFTAYAAKDGFSPTLYYSAGPNCQVMEYPLYYPFPLLHIPSYAPDGRPVREIQQEAFRENPIITKLTMGEGIQAIRKAAFASCEQLKTVYLPDSLEVLDWEAFRDCSALTTIHLGSGLRLIDHDALPLDSPAFTRIYYNGTIAQWQSITRVDMRADHPITVYCTDGRVGYSDFAADTPPDTGIGEDLTEFLATAEPMYVSMGETVTELNARVIQIPKKGRYEYKEVVLRYGIAVKDEERRFCFDLLSPEDGTILASSPDRLALTLSYDIAGLVYADGTEAAERKPLLLFYNYGFTESNDLFYKTQAYTLRYDSDGIISIQPDSNLSQVGSVTFRTIGSRPLKQTIRVLRELHREMEDGLADVDRRVLMATAPNGKTTVFSPAESPVFSSENVSTICDLTLEKIIRQGIPSFYAQYGPHKTN